MPVNAAPAVAFIIFLMIGLLFLGLIVSAMAFWIIALIDVARRRFPDPNAKLIWVLVVLFGHILGAIIYMIVGRPQGTLPV